MKHTLNFDPPIETIGELLFRLQEFVDNVPNPTEEQRQMRLVCTFSGKVKQITVTS